MLATSRKRSGLRWNVREVVRVGTILGTVTKARPKPQRLQRPEYNEKKEINGRGEWIRTTGLLVPNQALYQAEPRPEQSTV
jgi:hypothetical protein